MKKETVRLLAAVKAVAEKGQEGPEARRFLSVSISAMVGRLRPGEVPRPRAKSSR